MGYKSTSDEEDNDSDDNTQKPRLAKENEPQKEDQNAFKKAVRSQIKNNKRRY